MKLGVIADIHGNDVALRAVLDDAGRFGVERWWALGDLVLFGPRPAEVLQILRELPGIGMLRGNTDRYVLTGEQPAPHETVADACMRRRGRTTARGSSRGSRMRSSGCCSPGAADLRRRRHPQTEFVTSVLTGRHLM